MLKLLNFSCSRCSFPSDHSDHFLVNINTYMGDPRHPRHFTDDFERQIVNPYNAGKPKREIMGELESMRLGAAARTVDGFA